MTDKKRLEIIKGIQKRIKECQEKGQNVSNLHSDYVDWLIQQAERVEELEKQRNERTQLLNAEVARNVRYKKVLEKIVNHAGKGIDIDYELWKAAKRVLEGEE